MSDDEAKAKTLAHTDYVARMSAVVVEADPSGTNPPCRMSVGGASSSRRTRQRGRDPTPATKRKRGRPLAD